MNTQPVAYQRNESDTPSNAPEHKGSAGNRGKEAGGTRTANAHLFALLCSVFPLPPLFDLLAPCALPQLVFPEHATPRSSEGIFRLYPRFPAPEMAAMAVSGGPEGDLGV
jgi:hypothetical protein